MNPKNGPTNTPPLQSEEDDSEEAADAQAVQGVPPQTPANTGVTPMMEVPLPTEAEDSDLIEKEWVDRAKQIVDHTREDPYEQQRALSEMKADYLKKRYNKDIKLHDS